MTKPVTGLTTFSGSAPPWSLTQLDADIAALQGAINDLGTYANQLADTSGSANAITVSTAAGLTASYGFGLLLYIKVANTTTSTAVTVNLNGMGSITVLLPNGAAPPVGSFVAGGVYGFMHDGTNFQALSASLLSLLASNNTWTGTNTFAPTSGTPISLSVAAATNAIAIGGPATSQLIAFSYQELGQVAWILYQVASSNESRLNASGTGDVFAFSPTRLAGRGPTAAALVDMTPDFDAPSVAVTGFTSPTTAQILWSRNGNQVTVFIPVIFGTSNATSFLLAIPAAIQPAHAQFVSVPVGFSTDNTALITDCVLNVATTQFQFYHGGSAAGWTASGSKGSGGFSFSYLLN